LTRCPACLSFRLRTRDRLHFALRGWRRYARFMRSACQLGWVSALLLAGVVVWDTGCAAPGRWHRAVLWSRDRGNAELRGQVEADAHFAEGVLCETRGDLPGAVQAFQRALAAAPADEELAREVARRFLRYAQPALTLEVLQPFAATSQSSELHLLRAEANLQLNQHARAFEALKTARERGAAPAAMLPVLGALLQQASAQQGDADLLEFVKALMNAPEADAESLLVLGDWYARLSTLSAAERSRAGDQLRSLATRIAALNPQTPEHQFGLAELFLRAGQPETAVTWYERALREMPPRAPLRRLALARLADLHLQSSRPQQAAEPLRALLELDPTNVQAHYVLGNLAMDDNRPADAVDAYRRALAINPKFEPAYYNLAQALLAVGRPDEALAILEQARQTIGQTFLLEYLSGLACNQRRDYATARQHFTAAEVIAKATDTNRLTAPLYFQLGVTAERTGDFDAAVRHFETCLRLDPNFHPAQNYLGYMWAERGQNLERARELIEKAVQAEPRNSAYLDSMAWVLFQLGRPDQALPWMERALEHMEEPDATLYEHLGDILAALGRLDEARRAWQRALEIEPHNQTVRQKLHTPPAPQARPSQAP